MQNSSGIAYQILKDKGFKLGNFSVNSKLNAIAAAQFIEQCEPGAAIGFSSHRRLALGVIQCHLRELGFNPGTIDGYMGPMTSYAIAQWHKAVEYFKDYPPVVSSFPSQRDVEKYYGEKGQNQVRVGCPYRIVLAWNNDVELKSFSLHEKVSDSATRAMDAIYKEYGEAKIRTFGLNQFGGSLNVRLMRGSTTQWSMHSWGIAIDWYPQQNQWKWGRDRAIFAKPEYIPFFEIWEKEGWTSLGRAKNYDWMHVQAAGV
jgi:hypothetical protein